MTDIHQRFGTYGAWLNPALGDAPRIEYAPALEEFGYQTIWVGIGADPVGDMALLEQMIAATHTAIIATAIINMWNDDPRSIAHHYRRIVDRYGPRLLLGVGLGHPREPGHLRTAIRADGQLRRCARRRRRACRGDRHRRPRQENTHVGR